jgi:hypothetical protein
MIIGAVPELNQMYPRRLDPDASAEMMVPLKWFKLALVKSLMQETD